MTTRLAWNENPVAPLRIDTQTCLEKHVSKKGTLWHPKCVASDGDDAVITLQIGVSHPPWCITPTDHSFGQTQNGYRQAQTVCPVSKARRWHRSSTSACSLRSARCHRSLASMTACPQFSVLDGHGDYESKIETTRTRSPKDGTHMLGL